MLPGDSPRRMRSATLVESCDQRPRPRAASRRRCRARAGCRRAEHRRVRRGMQLGQRPLLLLRHALRVHRETARRKSRNAAGSDDGRFSMSANDRSLDQTNVSRSSNGRNGRSISLRQNSSTRDAPMTTKTVVVSGRTRRMSSTMRRGSVSTPSAVSLAVSVVPSTQTLIHGGEEQRRRRKQLRPGTSARTRPPARPASRPGRAAGRRCAAGSRRPASHADVSGDSAGCSDTSKKLIGLGELSAPVPCAASRQTDSPCEPRSNELRSSTWRASGCAALEDGEAPGSATSNADAAMRRNADILPPDRQLHADLARIAGPAADGGQRRAVRAGDVVLVGEVARIRARSTSAGASARTRR